MAIITFFRSLHSAMPQAIDTVVREGIEPMSSELRRALVEARLGVEIEDALESLAEAWHERIRFQLLGPVPPYDFVEGDWWV